MSIPSIRFQPGRNRRPQTPIGPKQGSKIKFTISSSSYSYSDDDIDDIPMLDSLNKQPNSQPVLLSSASTGSDEDYPVKENDWTARTRNPQTNNKQPLKKNNPTNSQLQRKIQNDEPSSHDSDNELIFQYDNDTNNTTNNVENGYNNIIKTSEENSKTEIPSNQQGVISSQPPQIVSTSNITNPTTAPEISPVPSNNTNENGDMTSNKLLSFFVFKQSSSFSKNKKNKYRMEENSKAIFFASESKDNKGKLFTITSSLLSQPSETLGFVRINSNHEVFTIITSEEKFNDDREGELCGIELCGEITQQSSSSKIKYRKIKIVIPKNGKPYYPISRRKTLSKIVQIRTKSSEKNMVRFKNSQSSNSQNDEDDSIPIVDDSSLKLERFNFYESSTPSDESEDKKSDELSKFLINPSPKNFLIRDNEGKTIFIFYKISSGSFNASFCQPITPIVAFGVSIAVLSSK